MKNVKRLIALVLAASLAVFCLSGCHQKDATVASYSANGKTYHLTSGEYAFALILAESEGRQKVEDNLTDAEQNAGTEVDYYKKTIDKKSFTDWVNDRAAELVSQYFYIHSEFVKNKLSLSDSDKESKDSYLAYSWSLQGVQYLAEPNGVSYESFVAYETVVSYESNALFKHLYGDEDTTETLTENFVVADVIELDPSTLAEDDESEETEEKTEEEQEAEEKALLEQAKEKLNGYVTRLNKGTSFEDIYYEYTGEEKPDDSSASTDEEQPKDSLATVYGAEDTSVANDLFETVKACEVGVPTVTETDAGTVLLVVRQEITEDPYYAETYQDECLYLLKGDEYTEKVEKAAKKLDVKFNNYERNYIKPKKIDYTEYQEYQQELYSQYYAS